MTYDIRQICINKTLEMKIFKIIALAGTLLFLYACNTKKAVAPELENDTVAYQLYKGGCFGTCPIYTLRIYNSGKAEYEGIRHGDMIGVHTAMLDKTTMATLKTAFANSDFFSLQESYESRIPDLPITKLMFNNGTKTHNTEGKETLPQRAKDLAKMMSEIVKNNTWKAKDPNASRNRVKTEKYEPIVPVKLEDDSAVDNNYVVIKTSQGMFLPGWLKSKKSLGIVFVEKLVDSDRSYVITYDKKKLSSSQILEILRSDKEIESAEFKKVNQPIDR